MPVPTSTARRLLAAALLWSAGWVCRAAGAEKWIRIESEHVVVYTDATAAEAAPVLREVELLIAALHEIQPKFRREGGPRVPFFLFQDENPVNKGGGYFLNREGSFIDSIMVSALGEKDHHPILHEMVHGILRVSRPKESRPAWFEEGQAELYSEIEITSNELRLGLPIPAAIGFLRREGLIPLAELFTRRKATSPGAPVNSERMRRYFYTEGWLFQHYTRIQPPAGIPAGAFERFTVALRQGGPVAPAFEATFGCTLEEMDRQLQQYLKQRAMTVISVPLARLKVREPFVVSPATPADLAYMETNMAESGKEPQKMKAKIAKSIAAFPDDGRIQMLKANDLFWDRNYAEAETYFRKKLAQAPEHPGASLGLAMAICEQQSNPPSVERAREAVGLFERAYALGSGFSGEMMLARALLALPDRPTDAQVEVLTGALRGGLNEQLAIPTSRLLDRQGKRAEARALLEWVVAEGKNERPIAEAKRLLEGRP